MIAKNSTYVVLYFRPIYSPHTTTLTGDLMKQTNTLKIMLAAFAIATVVLAALADTHAAAKEEVLYDFGPKRYGFYSVSGLIFDAAGNLYGTTVDGGLCGHDGCGTVFELTPDGNGKWIETVLYRFTGRKDGGSPWAGLVFDSLGNLYGTTYAGGYSNQTTCIVGCGVVFKLTPAGNGQWKESVLYTFKGLKDGANPVGSLAFDSSGNLYGAAYGDVVFMLSPTSGGGWEERALHTFGDGTDGANPEGPLVLDAKGNVYGATHAGGTSGEGTVFRLTATSDGKWKESILHNFTFKKGALPNGGLVIDSTGNLYGTTVGGGLYSCDYCGTVYKLEPSHGAWQVTFIHEFKGGSDGEVPVAGLVVDAAGNLYGTTWEGGGHKNTQCGTFGCGTVFELTPNKDGTWSEDILHGFTGGKDGGVPVGSVILDSGKNVYGTTTSGGIHGYGNVFQIVP